MKQRFLQLLADNDYLGLYDLAKDLGVSLEDNMYDGGGSYLDIDDFGLACAIARKLLEGDYDQFNH